MKTDAVCAPSTDAAYDADELLRRLGVGLGHDDITISCVGAFCIYAGHWTQISPSDRIGYGDTLVAALQDALDRLAERRDA